MILTRLGIGLLIACLLVAGTTGLVAADPPSDFPGSDTGDDHSQDGRDTAVEKSGGKANPPGTDDDGPPSPPGTQ